MDWEASTVGARMATEAAANHEAQRRGRRANDGLMALSVLNMEKSCALYRSQPQRNGRLRQAQANVGL